MCATPRVRECDWGIRGEANMAGRKGVTLIEVLVSIFVTAVGLLALLALFPVGAFSMATAIKNGRCVQAKINATGFAKIANIGQDSAVTNLFANPDPALPDLSTMASNPLLKYNRPSHPVYVD